MPCIICSNEECVSFKRKYADDENWQTSEFIDEEYCKVHNNERDYKKV